MTLLDNGFVFIDTGVVKADEAYSPLGKIFKTFLDENEVWQITYQYDVSEKKKANSSDRGWKTVLCNNMSYQELVLQAGFPALGIQDTYYLIVSERLSNLPRPYPDLESLVRSVVVVQVAQACLCEHVVSSRMTL